MASVLCLAPLDVRHHSLAASRPRQDRVREVVPMVGVSAVPAELSDSGSREGNRLARRHVVPGHRGTVLSRVAPHGPILLDSALTLDRGLRDLPFTGAAALPVLRGGGYLREYLLPARRFDGRGVACHRHSFD